MDTRIRADYAGLAKMHEVQALEDGVHMRGRHMREMIIREA